MTATAPNNNILFLSIEDLNDWIEPLGGHPDTITPNLQRLADRARLFTAAFTPAPACSPARTAALFGKYPWETGVYANHHKWIDAFGNRQDQSIIGRLKAAGYKTIGAGKVFHGPYNDHKATCWDKYLPFEPAPKTAVSKAIRSGKLAPKKDFGPLDEQAPNFDQTATDFIIDQMDANQTGQFWALGLYRPHLPFLVPQRFFDALPEKVSNPPGLGSNSFDPNTKSILQNLPDAAKQMTKVWRNTGKVLHETDEYNDFVRAYLASVHYADHLLGQVLDHMDETGLWETTHLVLWSDHGWQLGEKLAFRKFSLWERALRIPLMIAGPDISTEIVTTPVSLVDLAPTLLEIANLPSDPTLSGQSLLGSSLSGYVCSIWGDKLKTRSPNQALSVRSKTHRLILYWDNTMELYDHRTDPFEHNNLMFSPTETELETLEPILSDLLDHMPQNLADPITQFSSSPTQN
jgi:arylsulfatase A-like enzyme